jgi:hypothetical protein
MVASVQTSAHVQSLLRWMTNIVKEKIKCFEKREGEKLTYTDIHGRLQSFERFSRFKYFC